MEYTNTSYDDAASNYDSITNTNEGHNPDRKVEHSARSNENKDNKTNQAWKMIIPKRIIIALIVGMVVIAIASSAITATILKQVRLWNVYFEACILHYIYCLN